MGDISYEQLLDLVDALDVKKDLLDLILKIRETKKKYGYFNRIIADISKFRDTIIKGELSISEKEFKIIERIYNLINKNADINYISSELDEDTNKFKFVGKYYFVFDQVKTQIIEGLKAFLENNIKEADERHIYKVKVLICATADKFIENLTEMKEIDAKIYQLYKQKYYDIKNSYKKELKIDEELEIEDLVDEENEIVS